MKDYTTPAYYTYNDYLAIQNAIDEAVECGCMKVVIPRGIWTLTQSIKVCTGLHLILEDAKLVMAEGCEEPAIINNTASLFYHQVPYMREKFIAISGRGESSIEGANAIALHSVREFTIENLTFKTTGTAIKLHYATFGRLRGLRFDGCESGILYGSGTRDVVTHDVDGRVDGNFAAFNHCDFGRGIVYYHGVQTCGLIIRDAKVECGGVFAKVESDTAYNISLTDVETSGTLAANDSKHPITVCRAKCGAVGCGVYVCK